MDGDYIVLKAKRPQNFGNPFVGGAFGFNLVQPAAAAIPPDLSVDVASLNKAELADAQRDPEVVAIAPSMPAVLMFPNDETPAAAPNAPGHTWGVEATGALNSPRTGRGVTVAVLDTGIDASHPAFAGMQLVEQDFTGSGNGDRQGHGTHAAGTIFGRDVNGFRFGVAPGVERALIGKVLDDAGRGGTAGITSGILWALENGANVISMSLGMDFPGLVDRLHTERGFSVLVATSMALEAYRANLRVFDSLAAFIGARAALSPKGALVIAAAGNESDRPDFEITVAPPALAIGIVSVGALGQTGGGIVDLDVASFSNSGVNVAGPGVKILSAQAGGGFSEKSGTSMATPHVAGIAALWAEKLLADTGRIDPAMLGNFLAGRASTGPLKPGFDPLDVGAGLVQAPIN